MVYNNKKSGKRVYKNKPLTKSKVLSIVKKEQLKNAESKHKLRNHGLNTLFHNVVGYYALNVGANCIPTQGMADSERIGDKINVGGFFIRMMFLQKTDRKNVTFTVRVLRLSPNASTTYGTIFDNVTGNCLIDTINKDSCKVLYSKVIKKIISPDLSGVGGADKEFTFTHKMFIPYRKEYVFQTNNSYSHNDTDLYIQISAYDSYGTLITDNIANVQILSNLYYKDI